MTKDQFIEAIFEQAFGDNAINREFSFEEVLEEIKRQTSELDDFLKQEQKVFGDENNPCDSTEENVNFVERLEQDIEAFREGILNVEDTDDEIS